MKANTRGVGVFLQEDVNRKPLKQRGEIMDIINENPQTEWEYEAAHDTFIVHLPAAYKKEELKVQETNTGELCIKAERKVGENKRIRFSLRFPIRDDYDASGITAKFKVGKLSVRFPKIETSTGDGVGKTDEQPGVGACKQVFDSLVMVIKNPRRVMTMVLALLLVAVLGLYVKHAFMSMFGETDDIED